MKTFVYSLLTIALLTTTASADKRIVNPDGTVTIIKSKHKKPARDKKCHTSCEIEEDKLGTDKPTNPLEEFTEPNDW